MRFRLFLIMLFCSLSVFAQKKNGTLSGTVVEGNEAKPLQSAMLQLFTLPDTVFKAGVASDSEGKVSITAPADKYLLRISFVGCVSQQQNVVVNKGKNTDCGVIKLMPDDIMLEHALITAEVPPVTASEDT
ncbi:MAG: carboxypeptidase-like regulatory domain-containing protein, partial [Bacteroidaceae bacterium]|nr:carboxypeptidase-like regulatory domain-containing protein [Bacteroidaceae bacterium]